MRGIHFSLRSTTRHLIKGSDYSWRPVVLTVPSSSTEKQEQHLGTLLGHKAPGPTQSEQQEALKVEPTNLF